MLYPSIDSLLSMGESKFDLVVMVAARARQLQRGAKRVSTVATNKNVTVALNEIFDKQITFSNTTENPGK